jgi:soluble lytic murein transglycosylase-like protein
MAIDYRIIDGGYLEQQDPDGTWSVHRLGAAEAKRFDEKVARWFPLALDNEMRTGLPAAITLAIINGESGGNENAEGPPSDHGIGLMQITHPSLKQGLSDAEVFVPENNVRLGVDALTKSAGQVGYDPPKLASMFNAGSPGNGPHPSSSAPWGYREYKIPSTGEYPYISKVVRAYNYAIDYKAANSPEPSDGGSSSARSVVKTVLAVALAGGVVLGAVLLGHAAGARR